MTEPVITITLPAPVETCGMRSATSTRSAQWHGWETEGDEGSLDDEIRLIFGEGVIAVRGRPHAAHRRAPLRVRAGRQPRPSCGSRG